MQGMKKVKIYQRNLIILTIILPIHCTYANSISIYPGNVDIKETDIPHYCESDDDGSDGVE